MLPKAHSSAKRQQHQLHPRANVFCFTVLPLEPRALFNFSYSFFKILCSPSNSDLIQDPNYTTTFNCFIPILCSLYMFIKLTLLLLRVQNDFELLNRITGMHHSTTPGLFSFLPANFLSLQESVSITNQWILKEIISSSSALPARGLH